MTQPISVIAKAWYENACEPGSHWRKLPAVPGSPNPRFHNWSLATAILAWKRCGRFAWRWIFRLPGYWSRSNPSRR